MSRTIQFFLLISICFVQVFAFGQNQTLDSLLLDLKKAKEDSNKVKTLNNAGWQYFVVGDNKKAIETENLAISLAKKLNFKKGEAQAIGNIGVIFQRSGKLEEAKKYHIQALQIRKEIGDKAGMANSYTNIGHIYYDQGNFSEALNQYLASLKIRQEINDKSKLAHSYNDIGNVFQSNGNYSESLKNHYLALKYYRETESKEGVASSYGNIGLVYKDKGDYNEAIKYFMFSVKISKEINYKYALANAYDNIGIVYGLQHKFDEALVSHFESLKIKKEIDFKNGVAMSLNNIAILYANQKKYDEALEMQFESLQLSKELTDTSGIADCYNNIGELFCQQAALMNQEARKEKYKSALNYLDSGLLFSKRTGVKEWVKNAYGGFSTAYKGLGDYKRSLEYHMLADEITDSLLNKEVYAKMAELQVKYETDKITAERNLVEEKIKNKHRRSNNFIIMGIGIIVVSFLFVFVLTRQKNIKKRELEKVYTAHKMAELELQSLRAQLNPHFMFNSLNAIQELILKEDNDNSHLYLSRFSELLRLLLDNANQPFVSLRKEINLLELYLSLENLRIPDLKYSIEIDPSIDSNRIIIPNMMLQPYIENAIWHGLSHKKGERNLKIKISGKQDNIICEVEDNGVGRKMATELKSLYRKEHRSKGMELLSKRFSLLSKEYGYDIQTGVEDLHDNGSAAGTRVTITVPSSLTEQFQPVYS